LFNVAAYKFLNLEVSALEADGKGKIVSSPRGVTADQTEALIEQGTELPCQLATASGATAVAFCKANLKREVTLQITLRGQPDLECGCQQGQRGYAHALGLRHQHQACENAGAGGERWHLGDRRYF
jgi:type IV pilus assembly protein PilQ